MNTSGVVIPSEPSFIRTPFEYLKDESQNVNWLENKQSEVFFDETSALKLKRDIDSEEIMLDQLIDLIVFTPRGSFHSDPDFGFEFWNHEYKNINYNNFNNGQGDSLPDGKGEKMTKIECQNSLQNNLITYAPQLKNVHVEVKLEPAPYNQKRGSKSEDEKLSMPSKHCIFIKIQGERNVGLEVNVPYEKEMTFFIEPTVKRRIAS